MSDLKRQAFRLFHRLRVRWAEVDMQKIVFNAHYLMYFDTAMSDYWRELALPYDSSLESLGGDLYVKKATVEYHASAQIDDQLDVALRCHRIGTSSMTFKGAIFRRDDCLISCELVYVFADPATQTSKPVPAALREILLSYEAGEPMVSVEVGTWQTLKADASQVRADVFLKEQRIPVELEQDDADQTAIHVVARNRLGVAVATGRLLQHAAAVGRMGRMAVHRVLRGTNLGREVLQALMQAASERGDREVILHAQRNAQGFYARQGFVSQGEPFEEAGIGHIEMVLKLPSSH
ncbi:YbgC/FadM family acyl-CoA thioesterase [Rhodoferax sp. PAMC 29310]|uniref:YbgC/FadM family acyl-CoA thioesterase n=1 Tax=Rhodoferax sp. PAMC 29310 TaxID=2822760 RepID=UPI001B33243F|nr:YbgC/FadM family acyl-CoA thioesterase [Rhodoferax sp. PAMC 29310]